MIFKIPPRRAIFAITTFFVFASRNANVFASSCQFSDCTGVTCYSDVAQSDCDALQTTGDYYYRLQPEGAVCGCCPGCVEFINEGKTCSSNGDYQCGPGLACGKDVLGMWQCGVISGACLSYEFNNSTNTYWVPDCNLDGTFKQKQCKGEQLTGRCFCYSSDGKRIFGQQWSIKAENMTCACSRHVSDLKNRGRTVTMHCNEEGSYERLQCDSGLCWCAETKTGEPITQLLPEVMMKYLPCYNESDVGTQYFRKCDSVSAAIDKLRKEMNAHGTETDSMFGPLCDMDGSYGSYQISGSQVYCKTRNGTNLNGIGSLSDLNTMDCNCARDQVYFPESGMGDLTLTCSGTGSYATLQYDNNHNPFCVDSDGFQKLNATEDGKCS